jgi:hypothetical protein
MTIYYDALLENANLKTIINNADNHTVRPLKSSPYAQARVHNYYDENGYLVLSILQSYNTLVAAYDFNDNKIYCNGTYSRTTIRHIGNFAKELNAHALVNLDYYSFKAVIK